MQFSIKRDILLRSLNLVQGVIEKKNTLPILSNVLLEVKENKLLIIGTDLDLVFYDEIRDIEVIKEGSTTTSATILYDILRKIEANSKINFDLKSENKLSLQTETEAVSGQVSTKIGRRTADSGQRRDVRNFGDLNKAPVERGELCHKWRNVGYVSCKLVVLCFFLGGSTVEGSSSRRRNWGLVKSSSSSSVRRQRRTLEEEELLQDPRNRGCDE